MASKAILAIQIVSDASKAAKEIDSISTKTQRMGKVSSAAGKLFAVGLLGAAAAAVKFANAAAEDEASAAKLAQSLRKATDATDADVKKTEEWIEAKGRALGIADDQLRPAISKLAIATGDLGKAQKLAALAMDISAGSGKSLESVTQALAKAQTGSVAGLSKLGITTKDTVKDTAALKSAQIAITTTYRAQQAAIKEHGASSAEARLATQKYALAQDKFKEAQKKTTTSTITAEQATKRLAEVYKGAAANAAETTAGKQQRLKVRMDELQESIGARLIPALLALTTAGLAVVGWLERNQTTALILVGALGGLLAVVASINVVTRAYMATTAAWAAVTGAATAVQNGFKAAAIGTRIQLIALRIQMVAITVATKAWAVALKVAAIAQKIFNAAMRANPIGLIITAIALLVAGLVLAYKKSETFRRIVDAVGRAGQKAFGWIVDKISELVGWVKDKAPQAFNAFKTVAVNVGNAILAPFRAVQALIEKILDLIGSIKIPDITPGFDIPGIPLFRSITTAPTTAPPVVVNVAAPNGFIGSDTQLAAVLAPAISRELARTSRRVGA
jgi:hypothetical protein